MSLFYVPQIASACILPEDESQHAVKVLRLKTGDKIEIVDGQGGLYRARIEHPHPKHCSFQIIEAIQEYGMRNTRLHIAIAPTKNIERMEWFIEKATEIGIDEITPLVCRFSERKTIKSDRLEKIIVSAAKQSVKAYFPKLNPLCTFDELIKRHQETQTYIAHCYAEEKKNLHAEVYNGSDILILIGPEGDFSKDEVTQAIQQGFVPVSLGSSRLRTETAGLVACCTVAMCL